jgi:hypothetical protein
MRKLAVLASFLLSCAAFSAADSVTITKGIGTLVGTGFPGATYSFGFSSSGLGFNVPGPLDDFDGGRGLVQCNPCDPRTTDIEILHTGGATILRGNRFVEGVIEFGLPVSFVSSLAPSGVLTVDSELRQTSLWFSASAIPHLTALARDLFLFPTQTNSGTCARFSRPTMVNTFFRTQSSQPLPFLSPPHSC